VISVTVPLPLPLPLPLTIIILLRISILPRLHTTIIVLRLLLLVFVRGVLQPTQALLAGLEGCITTHFEYT